MNKKSINSLLLVNYQAKGKRIFKRVHRYPRGKYADEET